jgi:ABC-type lipopolysaccharide export system ATPase subunit
MASLFQGTPREIVNSEPACEVFLGERFKFP